MKKTMKSILFASAILLASGIVYSFTTAPAKGGYIKVYLKNDCSSDVKIYVTQSGGGALYTCDDKTTKAETFQAGQKLMDADQKHVIHEITTASEGKTIVVCQ